MWCSEGGAFLSPTMSSWRFASCPTTSQPRIAPTVNKTSIPSAHRDERRATSRDIARPQPLRADTWIHGDVEDVREQIAHNDHERSNDYRRGHNVVVARLDRVDGEKAHAGPLKDSLDKHRA